MCKTVKLMGVCHVLGYLLRQQICRIIELNEIFVAFCHWGVYEGTALEQRTVVMPFNILLMRKFNLNMKIMKIYRNINNNFMPFNMHGNMYKNVILASHILLTLVYIAIH